jgi:hypothetical protein
VNLSQLSISANIPLHNKKCTKKFTIFYYITRFGNTIFSQTAVNFIGASEQKLCCTSIASSSKLSWQPSSICINKINKININMKYILTTMQNQAISIHYFWNKISNYDSQTIWSVSRYNMVVYIIWTMVLLITNYSSSFIICMTRNPKENIMHRLKVYVWIHGEGVQYSFILEFT